MPDSDGMIIDKHNVLIYISLGATINVFECKLIGTKGVAKYVAQSLK